MNKRIILTFAAIGIATMALAGCSSAGSSAGTAPAATGKALATGKTSLGTIVVNGKGDTVYEFTTDTANSGKSTCYAGCDTTWMPVTSSSDSPTVTGVTGTVGTIKRTGGATQVTINGMPLYTYSGDSKAGDVTGQGMNSTWYVVSPAGTQITKAPGSSSGGSSGSSGAGGGWS